MNNLEQKAKEYSPESFLLQIVFKDGFRACEKEYEEKLRGISVEETQKPVQGTDLMINAQKFNYTEEEVLNLIFKYSNDLLDRTDSFLDTFENESATNFTKEWFNKNKKNN